MELHYTHGLSNSFLITRSDQSVAQAFREPCLSGSGRALKDDIFLVGQPLKNGDDRRTRKKAAIANDIGRQYSLAASLLQR